MGIARLTVHPFLFFDLRYTLINAIVPGVFKFQQYGARCGPWTVTASKVHLHFVIDDSSGGIIRVADRVSIVERHEEGV